MEGQATAARREGDKLVLGRVACKHCWGQGTVATREPCPACRGTGRGRRGGRGGCKECQGGKYRWNQDKRTVCPGCQGVDSAIAEEATVYDGLPRAVWESLAFRVTSRQRALHWVEGCLGGGIHTVLDYGQHRSLSDEELIAEVRDGGCPQICKVAREEPDGTVRLCDYVLITRMVDGYRVDGAWDANEERA